MVTLMLQGPDWNHQRRPKDQPDDYAIVVDGFDLDFMSLTIYVDDSGNNLRLAQVGEYMNEDGVECGRIGWVITPEHDLLRIRPELAVMDGWRYGRIIVTS